MENNQPKYCVICNKPLPMSRTKYCSNQCRIDDRAKGGKKAKLKQAKKKAAEFADINEAARAEGLTYGQYVAKYGL